MARRFVRAMTTRLAHGWHTGLRSSHVRALSWGLREVRSAHRGMTRDRAPTRLHHLLERDRELAEIDECIAGAAAGEGSFLVLEGRAGMGKSALLAETRRRAAEVGLTTCWALGSELEDEFAFGVCVSSSSRSVFTNRNGSCLRRCGRAGGAGSWGRWPAGGQRSVRGPARPLLARRQPVWG